MKLSLKFLLFLVAISAFLAACIAEYQTQRASTAYNLTCQTIESELLSVLTAADCKKALLKIPSVDESIRSFIAVNPNADLGNLVEAECKSYDDGWKPVRFRLNCRFLWPSVNHENRNFELAMVFVTSARDTSRPGSHVLTIKYPDSEPGVSIAMWLESQIKEISNTRTILDAY